MENRATAELINIIRTLYYDKADIDERDRLIKRIETEFHECDQRIDMYIRSSSKDLSRLIKVFNDVSKKIENTRSGIAHSREALKQCRVLLQSKRDDVRRLLLEWWEQKSFAEDVEKLKNLYMKPDQIRQLYLNKQYFEAAKSISESTKLLESDYREVMGLHDVKRQMDDERIKLEKYLYQDLSDQLYTAVRRSILESASSGLTREASFKRRFRLYDNSTSTSSTVASSGGAAGGGSGTNTNASTIDGGDLIVDLNKQNDTIIELIVKSALNLNNVELNMNILEKMINDINKNINNELIQMIHLTSTHVLESNLIDNKGFNYTNRNRALVLASNQYHENNPKLLNQLLELTFEQFKLTARYYREFINYASRESQVKYQSGLIWMCIQNVLIQLLEEYLDVKQANLNLELNDRMVDLNSYFMRKRLITLPFGAGSVGVSVSVGDQTSSEDAANRKIFTFIGSSHSMNVNQYVKEKATESFFTSPSTANANVTIDGEDDLRLFKIIVCQPSHRNITTIFSLMEHINKEISDEIRNLPSSDGIKPELTLEKFLQDFILNTFITNAVQSITENANAHSTSGKYESSKDLISLAKQRELNLTKPILQMTWLAYECCYDLFNLMKDMNSYASEFARAMFELLGKHVDECTKLYLSLVKISSNTNNNEQMNEAQNQTQSPQQQQSQQQKEMLNNLQDYVYSMNWVQDDSINKYFKQLPSFSSAIKGRRQNIFTKMAQTTVNLAAIIANNEVQPINYDILTKEVETLISNLNERELDDVDIIRNYNFIESLANLHESCDWLIVQLRYILNSIEQMIKNPKSLNNSLSINELNKLIKQIDEIDKIRGDALLLLYLETRLHCFFHLNSFIQQENNTSYSADVDTDPDEAVLNMNRDLHRIHEHLSRSLQESKVNYVFDALGFMIATIFIKAIKNFRKISTHGIAKMCRNIFHVEQNLSAIRTKSDPHLMKAHRFYELLYKKPEELLNHLQEHEAEFQLNDYTNLLNLIYRSQPGYEINSLTDNIQALANILKRKH